MNHHVEKKSGATVVRYAEVFHVGCGERLEVIVPTDSATTRWNCPKHPGQKDYAITHTRLLNSI